ncbi:MAG TPA: hypothetical protein VMV36_03890 [Ignavibacteriaceae bacterium]|nr:hypothetical protein [Ignavibacteriaceae bacterium]
MARGPGKGNTNNPNGRPAGTPNKTTKQAKEILNKILFDELPNIKEALADIKAKDKYKYLDTFVKLLSFALPKKTDLTSDDEKLPSNVNINVTSQENAKKLKEFLDGESK